LRYSIYKVHKLSQAESLFNLPHLTPFVKNFFHLSAKFLAHFFRHFFAVFFTPSNIGFFLFIR